MRELVRQNNEELYADRSWYYGAIRWSDLCTVDFSDRGGCCRYGRPAGVSEQHAKEKCYCVVLHETT